MLESQLLLKSWKCWRQQGAKVDYNDPYIPTIKSRREYKQFIGKQSVTLDKLNSYDLTIILTDHSIYDFVDYVVKHSNQILDTRNACGQY